MRTLIFMIPCFLLLQLSAFGQDEQKITGKVILKTKDGEKPGGHVNIIVFKGKQEITRGKSLGDGSFQLFPAGEYHLIPDAKYTIVAEPDKREKHQIGERIKKSTITVSGSEVKDVVIYSRLVKNRDKVKDERAGYFEGSKLK